MGVIHETKEHPEFDVELSVDEIGGSEDRELWKFVTLDCSSLDCYTPKELQELGAWLIAEGKRIGQEYMSNGAPKQAQAA